MYFDRNENKEVIALLGAGSMGTAIIRRFAAGRKILLGDISEKNLEKVAHEFTYSGYDVETCIVDALDKESVNQSQRRMMNGKRRSQTGGRKHGKNTDHFLLQGGRKLLQRRDEICEGRQYGNRMQSDPGDDPGG